MTIQGVIPPNVPLDKALRFLEDQAKTILPQGFTVDYAGRITPASGGGQQVSWDLPALGAS